MLRTKPVFVGPMSVLTKRWVAAGALVVAVSGCSSDASSSTTSSPVTTPVTGTFATTTAAVSVAPPTTEQVSTTAATTAPDATEPAPSTTTEEDQLLEAIDRAQTAMRNCYKAAPGPCDQAELEDALVGRHLESVIEQSAGGITYENVDALRWTVLDGPKLKGDELAVFIVCRKDPMVVTYPDGEVNDDTIYSRQEWYLLPVGNTWKLSEVIAQDESLLEKPCDS